MGGSSVAGSGSGGANASGGSNVTAGTSSGGSAGTSPVGNGSCSGPFGAAMPVLLEEPMVSINGISVTADEREIYYARQTAGELPAVVVRRTRASKGEMFGAVEGLPTLDGVCGANPRVNPDISDDGLTLYVTCTADVELGLSEGVSPLRVARRADRSTPFTLDPEPIGGVFASAGISADELTAFTDGEIFDTAPQLFTRASKSESFVGPQAVPGLATPFRSPDISSDGLSLFGATRLAAGGFSAIARAQRASKDAPFMAPEQLDLQLGEVGIGAPNITPSCSLYLIVSGAGVARRTHCCSRASSSHARCRPDCTALVRLGDTVTGRRGARARSDELQHTGWRG